jgi:hypothetical protein
MSKSRAETALWHQFAAQSPVISGNLLLHPAPATELCGDATKIQLYFVRCTIF